MDDDRDAMAKAREETLAAFGKVHVVATTPGWPETGTFPI